MFSFCVPLAFVVGHLYRRRRGTPSPPYGLVVAGDNTIVRVRWFCMADRVPPGAVSSRPEVNVPPIVSVIGESVRPRISRHNLQFFLARLGLKFNPIKVQSDKVSWSAGLQPPDAAIHLPGASLTPAHDRLLL